MEIKIALIEVLRKYKFVQAPDTEVELKDPTPACDEQLSDIMYVTLYYRFPYRLSLD